MFNFKKALAPLVATMFLAAPASADTYTVDLAHSNIVFTVNHLGFADVFGRFNSFEGTIEFDEGAALASSVSFVIDASSVDTNHPPRDEHLKSPDFLNAGEFPQITFTSTGLEQTGENTAIMTGDLTMLGTTAPVSFDVTLNMAGQHPRNGSNMIGVSARGQVDRTEFGINFGRGALGEVLDMMIEIEAVAN